MATKKLPKKVWVGDCLWDVQHVIRPNKFSDFLLLRRATGDVEEDGSTTYDYIVIDCHNQEFYPDTASVRAKLKFLYPSMDGRMERAARRYLMNQWLKFSDEVGQ